MKKEKMKQVEILETALNTEDPIKALMDMVEISLYLDQEKNFYDIDIVLGEMFINYIRQDTKDNLESLVHTLLAFIDSNNGDRLQSLDEGKIYYERWEHLCDLASFALENYYPEFITRFITSHKHGKELMAILYHNRDGLYTNDLMHRFGITTQNLITLLIEFEKENLIVLDLGIRTSLVKLDFLGRVYCNGIKKGKGDNHG